ncbi:NADPH-dependent FMN reductase [Flavobacterium tyrosinilyticum]|uniref:NADPH-dependent FMN reductase n=1 Tax=Flavobacterium tyrosinilyticum TaxID=1658740 RepID=UPI0020306C74|nr:NADPH-dependent FMN reductase [Flavobacterium tyrosinilyticum]MCM0666113.1 NAD(P)H-dependent oxidoreductase [Flavobacterium tyrosinilyticum]
MTSPKIKILAISGSTRSNSSNFKILKYISNYLKSNFEIEIFEDLESLPHFNPDLDTDNPPQAITSFRNKIRDADGVIICTPEYVFSLPGSLKNALEWCVSTTIFSNKNIGLITASASGEMGHQQLLLVMKTLEAKFDDATQLLIQGVRGKVSAEGEITSEQTAEALQNFAENVKNQFL